MRLASVVAAYPSRPVTNDDIIDTIRAHSPHFHGDLEQTLREIRFALGMSGSRTRMWRTPQDRPLDLLTGASRSALDEAGIPADAVDLLIYTGIGRGFLEPGGAYHAAAALGTWNAQCFDLLDACMSWTRALQTVWALFATGAARTALVVNAEFNMREGGSVYPGVYALRSPEQVEWTFPAFTIGEAATATVLVAADDADWSFQFASRPDLADLCNVPLDGFEGFCAPSDRIARNGPNRFTSFGAELHGAGRGEVLGVLERLKVDPDEVNLLVTHASSKRWWDDLAHEVGLGHAIHHVYPRTGNIVSASVPAAIADAATTGRLNRGDRVLGWVGSAGMSFAAYTFRF